jgi:DNA (cytosine-5)-methyltransferase 1
VADAFSSRRQSFTNVESSSVQRAGVQSTELIVKLGYNGAVFDGMANTDNARPQGRSVGRDSGRELPAWQGGMELSERPGPTNGFWGAADWLQCRDGKWRAVEPGTFPLVNGTSARVGRLRGYGNAIVAPVAQAFIEAYLEAE